jgi:hypothetical protein
MLGTPAGHPTTCSHAALRLKTYQADLTQLGLPKDKIAGPNINGNGAEPSEKNGGKGG